MNIDKQPPAEQGPKPLDITPQIQEILAGKARNKAWEVKMLLDGPLKDEPWIHVEFTKWPGEKLARWCKSFSEKGALPTEPGQIRTAKIWGTKTQIKGEANVFASGVDFQLVDDEGNEIDNALLSEYDPDAE